MSTMFIDAVIDAANNEQDFKTYAEKITKVAVMISDKNFKKSVLVDIVSDFIEFLDNPANSNPNHKINFAYAFEKIYTQLLDVCKQTASVRELRELYLRFDVIVFIVGYIKNSVDCLNLYKRLEELKYSELSSDESREVINSLRSLKRVENICLGMNRKSNLILSQYQGDKNYAKQIFSDSMDAQLGLIADIIKLAEDFIQSKT